MQFRHDRFYMHKNALDVCLEVRKVRYIGDNYCKLMVNIINLGYVGKPWVIEQDNNYTIMSNQYDNYIEIPAEKIYEARKKSGVPV